MKEKTLEQLKFKITEAIQLVVELVDYHKRKENTITLEIKVSLSLRNHGCQKY